MKTFSYDNISSFFIRSVIRQIFTSPCVNGADKQTQYSYLPKNTLKKLNRKLFGNFHETIGFQKIKHREKLLWKMFCRIIQKCSLFKLSK